MRRIVLAAALSLVIGLPATSRPARFGATIRAVTAGSLTQARVGHTATLLPSGKVLLAGGAGPTGVLDTAELFDPVTLSATTLTSSLTTARTEHTVTLLPQTETLLIAGQDSVGLLFSTEMFNPANQTFRALSPNVQVLRAGHTATLLLDGRVLITGGQSSGALGWAEAFDAQTVVVFKPAYGPEAGTFTALANGLVTPRWDHTATLLADGRILITGGRNDTGVLASAEIFDPATETITTLANAMTTPRAGHTGTPLPDGRVLLFGGEGASDVLASAEVFSPYTNSFSAFTPGLMTARVNHTATLLPTGIVLIAGGQNSSGILASTELHTPRTAETMAPVVNQITPPSGATGVDVTEILGVRFSGPMDVRTLTASSVTLSSTGAVAATISPGEQGLMVFVVPSAPLAAGTTFTLSLSSDIKDTAGNALAPFTSQFTTVAAATPFTDLAGSTGTTNPTVSATVPANAATDAAINGKIAVTFSEAMDPSTITKATFGLKQGKDAGDGRGGRQVAGTVSYAGVTAIFAPEGNLAPNTAYTVRVKHKAKNLAGDALASDFVWGFTTGATSDTTAPTVSFTVPANAATGVAISQKIAATFSEAMDPSTISAASFTLKQGTTAVAGTVTYAGVTETFNPSSTLAPNTAYTATMTTGPRDLAGNALASTFAWGFTTGATPDTTAPTVSFTVPADAAADVAINQKIAATFTEAMDPLTITTVTFTLRQGTTAVAGTVTYAGVTATFNPLSTLAPDTTYTATMTTGAGDLAGNALASTFAWGFTTGATPNNTPPTVSFTVPPLAVSFADGTATFAQASAEADIIGNAVTGVPISGNVAVTFSEAMDPLTITTETFTLKQGTTAVAGTVSYAGVTATFTPLANLAPLTAYTATITTGARNLAGIALAADFSWSFITGATPDTTRPIVSATVPANAATGVAISGKIAAAFSEAMDPLTISTASFTLKQGTTAVAGTVSYAGVTATFTPASTLAPLSTFTATVTTGARDLAGNALATAFSWSFTTGATPDTTRPIVSSTVPASAATAVAINQTINATFSEAMDPLTINTASLRVTGPGGTAVTGTVGYNVPSKIATFTQASNLAPNAAYTATLTTGARDLAGNALAANFVWSFTTAATPAGQAPVALGAATTFAVLAGSTVTNTGATTVNGDLGLSPGTAVTGFPPGIVNGAIHAGDPAAALAQLDLATAYNDAAGRTLGAIGLAGNLGGQTLTPGLYKSTSSLEISSGDLTLDAQGDANAVFILQMASTLTTTSARQVILSGGARAANVFWQVGSSATLGTGSVFKGNILALASITVTTDAAVEGRLLARTGAVTLDSNITGLAIPADTTAPTVSFTVPANAATGVAISGNAAA